MSLNHLLLLMEQINLHFVYKMNSFTLQKLLNKINMNKKITLSIAVILLTLVSLQKTSAQSNIKYGPDYVVFEAEDFNVDTPVLHQSKWTLRQPGDPDYLKYLTNPGASPAPINDNYLEFTGVWQGPDSELTYKFTCPKTGSYRLGMRMHCPLRNGELADKRNDVFIKLEGNYTSGNSNLSKTDLETLHKFYGRGPNNWGSCLTLEIHGKGHQRPIYNLIEGEEYTFTMKGRSNGASYDYIAFYTYSTWLNQNTDLALQLPAEIQPFVSPTGITLVNPTPGVVREGTSLQLGSVIAPINANSGVVWSTSDDQIISVDQNGLITALGAIGEKATITVTSDIDNTILASSEIEIVAFFEVAVTSVSVTPEATAMIVGTSIEVTKEVLPTSTHDPSVTWTSSNTAVATVDIEGNVTGVGAGMVTIRATSNENNTLYDETTVEVVPYAEQTVAFDDGNKYKNGTYYNQGHMEVTFDYHAGSLQTVNSAIKLYLRELNSAWQVQHDVLLEFTDPIGTTSGNITADIPLDGLTPTADLPSGNFYFLFVTVPSTSGSTVNKGLSPIIILNKSLLSLEDEILKNSLKLFPNPAKDYVTVENDNFNSALKAEIFNLNGALVKTEMILSKSQKIVTSHFQSGIYIIQFKSDVAVATKKLIIE